MQHAVLDAQRFVRPAPPRIDVAILRRAAWDEYIVSFDYEDRAGKNTQRSVKPLGIVYLEQTNMLLAWCLLREDYRTFRLDRMDALFVTDTSFRPQRVSLLRDHLALIRNELEASAGARSHTEWR